MKEGAEFISHENYQERLNKYSNLQGPHGNLLFVACDAGKDLATRVRDEYHAALKKVVKDPEKITEVPLMTDITNKFEGDGHDGTCPRIPKHVGGSDVFIFQNCMDKRENSKSLNDNLVQLLQMVYAFKGENANRIIVVVPYLPYSRQDKPSYMQRESSMVRFVADMLTTAGVDRTISYHPHANVRGYFPVDKPFGFTSGNDLFRDIFAEFKGNKETAAASIDTGGFKEVKYFAEHMGIAQLVGMKDRPEQHKTKTIGIGGVTKDKKRVLLMDDETATFGSCLGMIEGLRRRGIKEFHVAISHLRLEPQYIDRLKKANKLGMVALHATDSVPQRKEILDLPFVKIHNLDTRLAHIINSVHYDSSVSKLFQN